jgi:hypothetical protein
MAARSNAESDSDPRTDDGIEAVPRQPGVRLMRVSDLFDFQNSGERIVLAVRYCMISLPPIIEAEC